MKAYDKYKSSGVDWIGDIPERWEIRKLKYISHLRNSKTQDSELIYIALEHIESNTGKLLKEDCDDLQPEAEALEFYVGDVLFCKLRPYLAKCVLAMFNGKCSSELLVLQSKVQIMPKYLFFVALSHGFLETVNSSTYGSKMPRANWEFIGNMQIALPDTGTQTAIADYLERETVRIDNIIKIKETLIERLKEKRISIIYNAVTKGLNPNAKMKPSGVEWIGDIPEGWEVKKLSWLFNLISSGTTPDSNNDLYYNGEIPWVNTGDLNDNDLHYCEKSITKLALQEHSALHIFKKNTLIMAMYGATIGKLSLLKFDATTNQACCALDSPKNVFTKYVFYWLFAMRKNIISLAYGGGQPNISQALIKGIKISLPLGMDQQMAIAEYLDIETTKIEATIEKTNFTIEKFKEYRKALISAFVTGKIDVRSV